MTISEAMNAKLNEQITAEFSAGHKYLAMACAFEGMGLKIMHERFLIQAAEEREHAMRILHYIHEVGGVVTLDAVPKPAGEFGGPEDIVRTALESEEHITRMVNGVVALAESQKDYATRSFLQWLVDEQVEEVSSMRDLLSLVKMAGGEMLQVEARVRHEMMEKQA